jgi:hypothetical protein
MQSAEADGTSVNSLNRIGSMVCFGHQLPKLRRNETKTLGNRHNSVLVNSKEVNYQIVKDRFPKPKNSCFGAGEKMRPAIKNV